MTNLERVPVKVNFLTSVKAYFEVVAGTKYEFDEKWSERWRERNTSKDVSPGNLTELGSDLGGLFKTLAFWRKDTKAVISATALDMAKEDKKKNTPPAVLRSLDQNRIYTGEDGIERVHIRLATKEELTYYQLSFEHMEAIVKDLREDAKLKAQVAIKRCEETKETPPFHLFHKIDGVWALQTYSNKVVDTMIRTIDEKLHDAISADDMRLFIDLASRAILDPEERRKARGYYKGTQPGIVDQEEIDNIINSLPSRAVLEVIGENSRAQERWTKAREAKMLEKILAQLRNINSGPTILPEVQKIQDDSNLVVINQPGVRASSKFNVTSDEIMVRAEEIEKRRYDGVRQAERTIAAKPTTIHSHKGLSLEEISDNLAQIAKGSAVLDKYDLGLPGFTSSAIEGNLVVPPSTGTIRAYESTAAAMDKQLEAVEKAKEQAAIEAQLAKQEATGSLITAVLGKDQKDKLYDITGLRIMKGLRKLAREGNIRYLQVDNSRSISKRTKAFIRKHKGFFDGLDRASLQIASYAADELIEKTYRSKHALYGQINRLKQAGYININSAGRVTIKDKDYMEANYAYLSQWLKTHKLDRRFKAIPKVPVLALVETRESMQAEVFPQIQDQIAESEEIFVLDTNIESAKPEYALSIDMAHARVKLGTLSIIPAYTQPQIEGTFILTREHLQREMAMVGFELDTSVFEVKEPTLEELLLRSFRHNLDIEWILAGVEKDTDDLISRENLGAHFAMMNFLLHEENMETRERQIAAFLGTREALLEERALLSKILGYPDSEGTGFQDEHFLAEELREELKSKGRVRVLKSNPGLLSVIKELDNAYALRWRDHEDGKSLLLSIEPKGWGLESNPDLDELTGSVDPNILLKLVNGEPIPHCEEAEKAVNVIGNLGTHTILWEEGEAGVIVLRAIDKKTANPSKEVGSPSKELERQLVTV